METNAVARPVVLVTLLNEFWKKQFSPTINAMMALTTHCCHLTLVTNQESREGYYDRTTYQ